jgi:hypothetical protein
MSYVRSVVWENQIRAHRSDNLLKGGVSDDSPFYHTFGNFVHFDFSTFDPDPVKLMQPEFFPLNMNYKNFDLIKKQYQSKLPHLRIAFKDRQAVLITIKLICLHIRLSTSLHNNEKQKLHKNLKFLMEEFLGFSEYLKIYNDNSLEHVDPLTMTQFDLLMCSNSHRFYKKRCEDLKKQAEIENDQLEAEIDKQLDVMIYKREPSNFASYNPEIE